MIPALQAIMIGPDPELRVNIALGRRKIIILRDLRDYHNGGVILFSHILPWMAMANITEVRHKTIADVSKKELEDCGYNNRIALLNELSKTNHTLTLRSLVTVIRWDEAETMS